MCLKQSKPCLISPALHLQAETDEILQKVNITREEEDFTSFDEFLAIVKFMHDQ